MNKKFLSAILFGALMVTSTGTFVSCKDYDDDIDNLQEQINKLATKEDMTSQIATLQAALTAAQTEAAAAKSSAEQALAKANSAESAATEAEKAAAQAALDAANAKAEAIKAAQDEVAKVKASLEATIDTKFNEAKDEFAKTITDLTEKVEKLTGLTAEMITSLDLQEVGENDFQLDLNYYQIAKNKKWDDKTSYTFGKDLDGSFTVSAGEIFTTPASLLVSVAPANAALPAEILSIVDSEGTSINDYINLTSVSYTDKLYKGSRAAANGLYTITAELKKDADKDAFGKLLDNGKTDDKKYVAFAIAATKEDRTVTSTYDVTIQSTTDPIEAATEIDTKSTIKSSIEEEGTLKEWNGYKGQEPSGKATPNNEDCYPVVDGEAFTIKVASTADADATETKTSKVLASYVVVDIENKALSTTDKAAINNLTITGDVKKVSKDNVFNIAIGGTYAKGVVVPLKVVTIDYTGTEATNVVWVKAGGSSDITQVVTYVVTPDTYVATPTQYAYEGINAFVVPADAASYKLAITDEDGIFSGIKEDSKVLEGTTLKFFKDAKGEDAATKVSEVAYAKLATTLNLQTMKDSKVYEGIVKFYNAEGTFLSQSTIKVQKVLPTAFPSTFSAKTNAINNGVLTVYPEPTSASDKNGVFKFSKAFNGLDGAEALTHIVFSSTDVNLVGDGDQKPVNAAFDNSAYTINTINPDLINDGKTYGAKVAYDYGNIAYTYKTADNQDSNNWSIDWAVSFSIKFGCMIVDSKYDWVSEPVVYYNEDTVIGVKTADVISVKDAYNAVMDPFTDAENWNKWAAPINGDTKVTLQTTNEEGKVIDNEFYTAVFDKPNAGDYNGKWTLKLTKKSTEVVLKDDVKTSVIITITDKFGHEHNVPALTFTMKKSH